MTKLLISIAFLSAGLYGQCSTSCSQVLSFTDQTKSAGAVFAPPAGLSTEILAIRYGLTAQYPAFSLKTPVAPAQLVLIVSVAPQVNPATDSQRFMLYQPETVSGTVNVHYDLRIKSSEGVLATGDTIYVGAGQQPPLSPAATFTGNVVVVYRYK